MFRIGAPVYTVDGKVGELRYVVLDPVTHAVSDLVIETGAVHHEERVVPVHLVKEASAGRIELALDKEGLQKQRRFHRDEFEVPSWPLEPAFDLTGSLVWASPYGGVVEQPRPVRRVYVYEGVDDEAAIVGKGTEVRTRGGEHVGTIDHIAVDPENYEVLYLILRLPGIRVRRVIVPRTKVREWRTGEVILDLDRVELDALPPYTPAHNDATLATKVREAIEALKLRVHNLDIHVEEGHVRLRGHVKDAGERRRIDEAARAVEGVLSLDNALTTDSLLRNRIEQRLLDDPVASLYPVDISVMNRVVRLSGTVPSHAVREIILEIVRGTPLVVSAIDEIEVRPEAFDHTVPLIPQLIRTG